MRNTPQASELLELARDVLLQDLAPLLPEERRYDLLMIAAVLAIVARELEGTGAAPALELETLLGFYPDAGAPAEGSAPEDRLTGLNRRLAAEVRAGVHDGSHDLHGHLTKVITAYLSESNPKVLERQAGKKT